MSNIVRVSTGTRLHSRIMYTPVVLLHLGMHVIFVFMFYD
jgi:hypothetical protein